MSDFTNPNGVAVPAKVTSMQEQIMVPYLLRWAAQGKIFSAGQGLQDAGIQSQGETTLTPDDVKATVALQAPVSGTKIIVPIQMKVMWEVEGGAATDYQLIQTKSASECATALTLSGRDMLVKGLPLYSTTPVQGVAQAKALYGVATTFLLTVSALTTADQVIVDYGAYADNNVSAPLATAGNRFDVNFLATGCPPLLTAGAALILYISAATSDCQIHPYIQWAELDPEDLV